MSRFAAGAAIVLAIPFLAAHAGHTQSVASDASDIFATFTSGTMSTSLGPINEVSGSFPPAYSRSSAQASYTGSVTLPPLVPQVHPIVANLDITAANLRSSVASKGIQLDFITAAAHTSIGAATLDIVSSGPAPGVAVVDFLNISTRSVAATASYTFIFPSTPSVAGSASLSGVKIGGALLGGQTVTFSGSPPANTVLFRNANVTIVANEQIAPVTIICGDSCKVVPISITVHPLAVHLTDALILNGSVTGAFDLGSASAS